ncbi:MAG: winged helix DNA-binding domain-containing protein [Chloroflexota bacterium]|nr:winged helix DNA-binding domain-containing protein [Chloroflexota bacterium]
MEDRPLTARDLRLALLDRQSLLSRTDATVPALLEQVGGLQTQYSPSGYVGLWSRMAGFQRDDLTRVLEERHVVQATLMRTTIHLVSGREYWLYAMGVRRARREWWSRTHRDAGDTETMQARANELRAALKDGPRSVSELGELASGFLGNIGLWVDLVRVPPSGTWERRRANLLGLAETWLGSNDATEDEGLEHLVRAYLRGYGPAPYRDISLWAGVPVTPLKAAGARMELRRFLDEAGHQLVDIPEGTIPPADTPVPVRLLPHWDANLLVHARRTELLPEAYRPRIFDTKLPFSVGTILVGGVVVGSWSLRDGRIALDLFEQLPATAVRDVREEAARLEAFHA